MVSVRFNRAVMQKRLLRNLIALIILFILSGCSREMIFEEKKAPESVSAVKMEALEAGSYYVKEGTSFYKLYEPQTNFYGEGGSADASRIIWTLHEEDELIPTLKQGEPLVLSVDEDTPQEVVLERFKDIGYSIGVSGLTENEAGMQEVLGEFKKGSEAEERLVQTKKDGEKKTFSVIDTVSDKKLTDSNISSSGIVTGLKEGKTYKLGTYSGGTYKDFKVKADTHIYQSSETISLSSLDMTKNGYIAIDMPGGLKTGYYLVPGAGMFFFDSGDEDVNLPNETVLSRAVDDTLKEESRTFTYKAEAEYESLCVRLSYDTAQCHVTVAFVRRPNGEKEEITESILEIKDVKEGTYTIFVKGKNVDLITVTFTPGVKVIKEPEKEEEEESEMTPAAPQKQPNSGQSSASTASTPPQNEYVEVPINDPLNSPEISGTIGD